VSKFYQTKDFKKLNDKWQKKLKKSGFEDIEQDEFQLKIWSSRFGRSKVGEAFDTKSAYYYMATHFLNDYTFQNNTDKLIWKHHADAVSIKDIFKLLKKMKVKITFYAVRRTIVRLEQEMKELYKKLPEEYEQEF
jgi:hypothetical protein